MTSTVMKPYTPASTWDSAGGMAWYKSVLYNGCRRDDFGLSFIASRLSLFFVRRSRLFAPTRASLSHENLSLTDLARLDLLFLTDPLSDRQRVNISTSSGITVWSSSSLQ
jgi:hypothetical protein